MSESFCARADCISAVVAVGATGGATAATHHHASTTHTSNGSLKIFMDAVYECRAHLGYYQFMSLRRGSRRMYREYLASLRERKKKAKLEPVAISWHGSERSLRRNRTFGQLFKSFLGELRPHRAPMLFSCVPSRLAPDSRLFRPRPPNLPLTMSSLAHRYRNGSIEFFPPTSPAIAPHCWVGSPPAFWW